MEHDCTTLFRTWFRQRYKKLADDEMYTHTTVTHAMHQHRKKNKKMLKTTFTIYVSRSWHFLKNLLNPKLKFKKKKNWKEYGNRGWLHSKWPLENDQSDCWKEGERQGVDNLLVDLIHLQVTWLFRNGFKQTHTKKKLFQTIKGRGKKIKY